MENINSQDLQVIKVEYNESRLFFSNYPFNPAIEQVEKFIQRNKGKFEMRFYFRNRSPYGKRWHLFRTVKI